MVLGLNLVLAAEAFVAVAAAKPQREPVAQTKTAGRQTLFVGRADGAVVLDVGRVGVRGEGCDERVEDVGGKRHQRRQARV